MSLTKKRKLRKGQIEEVKKKGIFYQATPFSLRYRQVDPQKPSSFAFVISKKVSKQATARNRTRRLFSGNVRELLDRCQPGYEVIFLVKSEALNLGKEEIAAEVEKALTSIGLLKND
ncbi:ribonuclease P protein component [Candidatus Shapirobacteria bacterium]|nr:ribonuclease P protein component [Candidatus Shapirobacteria bacterium]